MWTKSYYSNAYLGSSGEGSHAANLSGLLLDLFPRSRELIVEQSQSSWKKNTLAAQELLFCSKYHTGAWEVTSPRVHYSP